MLKEMEQITRSTHNQGKFVRLVDVGQHTRHVKIGFSITAQNAAGLKNQQWSQPSSYRGMADSPSE